MYPLIRIDVKSYLKEKNLGSKTRKVNCQKRKVNLLLVKWGVSGIKQFQQQEHLGIIQIVEYGVYARENKLTYTY